MSGVFLLGMGAPHIYFGRYQMDIISNRLIVKPLSLKKLRFWEVEEKKYYNLRRESNARQ